MDHHPDCPGAAPILKHPLTVKKHLMEAMCLEPEGNLATTIDDRTTNTNESLKDTSRTTLTRNKKT